MNKASGLLWALERRGTLQLARILLQSSVPARQRRTRLSRLASCPASPHDRRRPRPATTLRLVLS